MMEQKFEIKYETSEGVKTIRVKNEEAKVRYLEILNDKGYKVIKTTKLYPFSTNKNQHNFMLVKNRCYNLMYDMDMGNIKYNEKEYNMMTELAAKADKFFSLELPVAWLDWNSIREANKIARMAIEWRIDSCINNNRLDLIQYCY